MINNARAESDARSARAANVHTRDESDDETSYGDDYDTASRTSRRDGKNEKL